MLNREWSRAGWALLALILVAGGYLYTIGYDRGLPLLESRDERRNLHEIYAMRGITDDELWKPGYPPGILAVNYGAQRYTEWATGLSAVEAACDVIRNIRLAGIPVNLLSALLIALLAGRLAGGPAGLLAAAAWLFNPAILDQTQYAFPQVYELATYLAAFYLALLALQTEKPAYALASTAVGLLAVVFKYLAFPVLGLGVGASVWLLRRHVGAWLGVLSVQVVMIVTCAVWLLVGYDAFRLIEAGHEETVNVVAGTGLLNLLDPALIAMRVNRLLTQSGLPALAVIAVLVGGGVIYWRRTDTVGRLAVFALSGLTLLHLLMVVVTLAPNFDGFRQNIPASGYVLVLLALSIAALAAAIGDRLKLPRAASVIVGGVAGVWLIPQMVGAWQYVNARAQPVAYGAFSVWAGDTLPIRYDADETTLLSLDERVFTRVWTCHTFPFYPAVERGDVTAQPLAQWRDEGVAFAQTDAATVGQVNRDEMTLLAEFPPEGAANGWRSWRRGLDEYRLQVWHLWPVQRALDTVFAEQIRLAGYTLENAPQTGEPLTVWLYWQTVQPPAADYRAFIHITPPDDPTTILVQGDGPPTGNPFRPTTTWGQPGEHLLVGRFVVPLPGDLPAGGYQAVMGLYDPATGIRLQTQSGTDSVTVPLRIQR